MIREIVTIEIKEVNSATNPVPATNCFLRRDDHIIGVKDLSPRDRQEVIDTLKDLLNILEDSSI